MDSKLRAEPLFYLSLAAACLLFPIKWLAAWLAAVCVHEMCHILMLRILGYSVKSIAVGPAGAVIETGPMPAYKELLCAVAGPVGSFSLLLLSRWMPLVAICGFVQGGYNLIPLHPMDGGRALRSVIGMIFDEILTERIMSVISWVVMIAFIALGLYCLVFLSLGALPFLFALLLAVRTGKIPCKTMREKVQ